MPVTDARAVHLALAGEDTKGASEIHIEEVADADDSDAQLSIIDANTPRLDLYLTTTHLISSSYPDLANQLTLAPLSTQSRLFAVALIALTPVCDDYPTAPYTAAFNWPVVFETLRALCQQTGIEWRRQDFYVVIFRSQLRAHADRNRLAELDQKAHEEACASGGLLKYWFGSADAERRNLATCTWVTREDAAAGGRGPWHKKARGAAREAYETISFHTHTLVVDGGASSWELKEFDGQ